MSEQNTIPPEMLEAAEKEVKAYILSRDFSGHITASDAAQFILEAAGVPALLAKVAELERELAELKARKGGSE